MVMCLGQSADLHMAQLMPLSLTIFCSTKSRLVLPSWFYLSGTGSRQNPESCKTVEVVVVVTNVSFHVKKLARFVHHFI